MRANKWFIALTIIMLSWMAIKTAYNVGWRESRKQLWEEIHEGVYNDL